MKKIFVCILIALFCISCENSHTFKVPELTGRVVDTSNILSKEDKTKIENAISIFEKSTKGQFVVCIIDSLYGKSIEQASIKIAELWKIGNKNKDDGIIFLLAIKQREFRIQVGYGFEEKINDAKAGDLGRIAIPYFKENKWTEGIIKIIEGSNYVITNDKLPENISKELEKENRQKTIFIIILIIVLFVFVIYCGDNCGGGGFFISGGSGSSGGFSGRGGSFGGGGFSGKF